jgi:histidine triad (HIT) family protein
MRTADTDCMFCRIVRGEMDADKLFEDDEVLAFRDI